MMNSSAIETEKRSLMEIVHKKFDNGMRSARATAPKKWLENKSISAENSGATFNSGQIHHRQSQSFKDALESIGLLKRSEAGTNGGQIPYNCFGNRSVLFPLRNEKNEIVNFYAMSIKKKKNSYLNKEGVYPAYPDNKTKTLYITDTILDAATLLESKLLDNRESVLALHNGKLMPQHKKAIANLEGLTEVIYLDTHKINKG